MPRLGWVAAGAAFAALLADAGLFGDAEGSPLVRVAAVTVLAAALLVAAAAAALRNVPLGGIAAGATLVAVRLLVAGLLPAGAAAGPLPASLDGATLEIVSVSAPSGGVQRGVAAIVDDGTDGLRLYCRLPRYPEVAPGDRVRASGRVQPPPDGPGFGDYLRRTGVGGTFTAREIERVPAPEGPAAWLERRRRDAGDLLARVLPAPQAGLAAGILIGLRDLVDRGVSDAFTAAGLTHIVAISGWNIAVVGGALAAILRRSSRRRRSVATLAVIAAYALAAGAGASVIRAALMAAAVLGSRELGRPGTAAAALALAALAMLLVDPAVVADAGFQLSVAATAGLLAWGTALTAWLRARLAAPGARFAAPGWLLESLGVSLAAQAATLPLVLLDFGRVSLVSPVANLAAAPLVIPVMAASAAALGAAWLVSLGAPGVIGPLAGTVGGVVLGALVAVGRAASAVPGASVSLQPPLTYLLAAASAAAVAVVGMPRLRAAMRAVLAPAPSAAEAHRRAAPRPRDGAAADEGPGMSTNPRPATARHGAPIARPPASTPGRPPRAARLAAAALAVGLVAVAVAAAARPDGRLRLAVLDVGQGDAILLQDGRGGRVLVDAGPDPERLLALLDERIPAWDRRLDLLVLTHPHEDHVAGAALLLRRYRVARVAEPGMRGNGPGADALADQLAAEGRGTERLAAGDRIGLSGGEIRVLWPRPGAVPDAPGKTGTAVNDVSIVLDVRYGQRRFLLMADAEQEVDAALLADGLGGPRVDLLKVAHHGSRTASTEAFLDVVRPAVAVVSVGAQNDYGHPAAATMERLAASGARVVRTDRDGSVTASTDGSDLRVESRASTLTALVETPGEASGGCLESGSDSLTRRSRLHPARARSAGLVPRARGRRCGGRRVPRGALRRPRRLGRSGARRGRRAPP